MTKDLFSENLDPAIVYQIAVKRLLKKLKDAQTHDIEVAHLFMDNALIDFLNDIYCLEAAEIYRTQTKWYA